VRTGAGAGRVAAKKKIDAERASAEANPSRAVDPQKALNQRRTGEGSKNLVADEGDALGDLLVAQREESRARQMQTLQLFAASETVVDVGFHLDARGDGSSWRK